MVSGNYKLSVLLTEDSIIAPQTNYDSVPDLIPDYVHRHILRDDINGGGLGLGETVFSGTINTGDTAIKKYSYIIPAQYKNTTPNTAKMSVVAFLYDDDPASPKYREVVQVERKKIQ